MEAAGLLFGFAAALFQSTSYVFTRMYVVRRQGAAVQLLIVVHAMMGLAAAGLLPVLLPETMPPVGSYIWPLLGTAAFYLSGQAMLFATLRGTDASRIAPLLGLKILILALLTFWGITESLDILQWVAVLLSVSAAFVLNYAGGSLPLKAVGGVLATCVCYCLSDLSIVEMVDAFEAGGIPRVRGGILGAGLCYALLGVASLAALPLAGRKTLRDWRYAVPTATFWFLGMVCLFSCFATIGVVYGNILQSTRGIISIVLGHRLAVLGWVHLEQRVARGVLVRRIIAAAMMSAAIALFQL